MRNSNAVEKEFDFDFELAQDMGRFSKNPLGFVRYSFPWGEPGSELEDKVIQQWQINILNDQGKGLINYTEAKEKIFTKALGLPIEIL